jgi:hypothetical protein
MKVPLQATQPPASELLGYDEFVGRLEALKSSPRVRVETPGRSNAGRDMHCIVVAGEDVTSQLNRYRTQSLYAQSPRALHRALFTLEATDLPEGEAKYPVLVTGLSFGHEAAHVEALLRLAEELAWGHEERTLTILSRLIVLIMPMMNPDGRMMAIETWKRHPLAADSSAGNLYGFYLNRDFVHLTQPETRAVLQVYREWHPLALLDTHEDVFILGVQVPEICWCPAYGLSTVDDAPQTIREITGRLGQAIVREWQGFGFDYLKRDLFTWTKAADAGEGPRYVANGTIVQAMALHGIPAVITESARTPGTQTWEDRLQQKVSAGFALLAEIAGDPADVTQAVRANRERDVTEALKARRAFILPQAQRERGALLQLVDTLLLHGVQVYQMDQPYEAFVIPMAQAEATIIEALLGTRTSKLFAMPPALGVAVARFGSLPRQEQQAIEESPLRLVSSSPPPVPCVEGESETCVYAISNTTDGIRLVNRLLAVGANVRWSLEPHESCGPDSTVGAFLVEGVRPKALEMIAKGLAVNVRGYGETRSSRACRLWQPRVGLYVGQGVDGHDASARADVWWALDRLEFSFMPLQAEDITEAILDRYDLLIVPSGNVQEIVNGWGTAAVPNSLPWELPGEPHGIGTEGLEAIRQFVHRGGTYFGVDGGGGLLALKDYADIIDLEVMAYTLGYARVLLRVDQPDHPLMFGLNGYYDDSGTWQEGFLPAYYQSDRFEGLAGGLVFRPRNGATAMASYDQVDHNPGTRQLIQEEYLTRAKQGVALAHQKRGEGHVVVTGIRPGFRGVWINTWKLISNAAFLSVAEERAE